MKRNISCLLLAALSIIILPLLFSQQDQNSQGPDPEIAALKRRILELENKLQTVENVEKMELAAKLADANAKLANAEFGKFKRELRDSNDQWFRNWILLLLAILSAIGAALWFWFKSISSQLIASEVEKSLNGFKEAVDQVNILKSELRVLQKEHTAAVLENFILLHSSSEYPYPEKINVLPETALVDVFGDETRPLTLRHKAAEILANRRSTLLVASALKFLNLIVDSDLYTETGFEIKYLLRDFVSFVGYIETLEAYQGLKEFLHRLLTKNPKHKDLFLTDTVFSIASVGTKLNMRDSVAILKTSISHLDVRQMEHDDLKGLAAYFDMFNELAGIKEILIKHAVDGMPDVEEKCLELLQKHDPDFVEKWQGKKETANTENKESS